MELGNMIFGNSRGNFEVPRKIVDCNEWIELIHNLIQVEDYHCYIGNYYQDYSDARLKIKPRTSPISKDDFGGCTLKVNDKKIFSLFPYWNGDCTCGVEEENNKLEKKWKNELFTPYQWKTYMTFDDWCEDDCPTYKNENKNKTKEELLKICTCGCVKKNIQLQKRKDKFNDKIKEFERREMEEYIPHKDDCLLLKHNFIYHQGQEDEFWIDWYKYPFRDSYMNKNLSEDEIKNIFKDCINQFKKKYEQK